MANPPLTTSASCEQATADTSSTKLTTEQPISDATVGESSQDQATERKLAKLSALKRKKNERRKRRNRQRREEARAEADAEARAEADAEASVQAGADSNSQVHDQKPNAFPEQQHSAASSSHGVEGQTPSTPETSSSEELTPKAMQFGDIGASSSRMALDLTMLAVPCAKQDCGAVCGFKDGASVVCPKCGPYSMTRYCGQLHLWEDVKSHWVFCSTQTIDRPCLASSISADALVGPPMLPCLHQWDTPARHRQAVWFSSARHLGDYFIFADWTDPMTAGDDPASHMRLRCSPQVAFTVRFEDAREKDRFRRCLAICLFGKFLSNPSRFSINSLPTTSHHLLNSC